MENKDIEYNENEIIFELPDDTIIDDRCFICKKLLNRENPYIMFQRIITKDNKDNSIDVFHSNPILEICSKKCYEKFGWIVGVKEPKDYSEDAKEIVKDFRINFPKENRSFWSIVNKFNNIDINDN